VGYYPLFLEMEGRPCLVVGGGEVATRKVEALLSAGAHVTVVSPKIEPQLARLRDEGRIQHEERDYEEGDVSGYQLVIAATDDEATNERVSREARMYGALVNVVDRPELCDFIVPATVRQGEVALAISTGGLSPALARWLRQELEGYLSRDFALLAELLAEVRRELRERDISVDPDAWQRAIDGDLRALLSQGRRDEAKKRLLAALGAGQLKA